MEDEKKQTLGIKSSINSLSGATTQTRTSSLNPSDSISQGGGRLVFGNACCEKRRELDDVKLQITY